MKYFLTAILLVAALAGGVSAAIGQDMLLIFNSSANVNDQSGNGLNFATFATPTFGCTGIYGVCNFSTSNYISRNPGLTYYNEFLDLTAFVGFNITTGTTGDLTIISNGNASFGQNTFSMQYRSSSAKIVAGLYNGTEYETFTCDVDFSPDSQYHTFVWSYNATARDATCALDGVTTTNRSTTPSAGGSDRSRVGVRQDATVPFTNGTVYFYGLDRRPYVAADYEEVSFLNMDYWTSSTPTPLAVNLSVSTLTRTLPETFDGFHTAYNIGYPTWLDVNDNGSYTTLRNQTADLIIIDSMNSNNTAWRFDWNGQNVCTSLPCNLPTTNTTNDFNINRMRDVVAVANARNIKVHVVMRGMPEFLADKIPECNYGTGAPNYYYTSCPTKNHTQLAEAQYQVLDALGCFDTYAGTCVYEGWNEMYLRTFWLANTSTSCTTAVSLAVTHEENAVAAFKTRAAENASLITEYWQPSVNTGFSSCGREMTVAFLNNWTQGVEFDYANFHEYDSGLTGSLVSEYASAEANATAYGWGSHWGITETNRNNNAFDALTPEYTANLGLSWIYAVANTSMQRLLLYPLTCNNPISSSGCEDYLAYSPPQLDDVLRAPYYVSNTTSPTRDGGTVYACNSTNQNVSCVYVKKNTTSGILYVSSYTDELVDVERITFSLWNATAATLLYNNTSQIVTSGYVEPDVLPAYTFAAYEITSSTYGDISINSTSPSSPASISEPNNQTFTFTYNNPENQSVLITWDFNGTTHTSCTNLTSCTFTGNYTSAGNYNISFTATAATNSVTYSWNFTVNNTVSAISFNTVSPTSNPTISEQSNQAFSYTLTNPDSLATIPTWYLNGVNQTGCYNSTGCTIVGPVIGPGTYTVNVTVAASTNTISNAWTLTVSSAESCSNVPNGALIILMLIMIPVMFVWGLYEMLVNGNFSTAILIGAIIAAIIVVSTMPGFAASVCIL